MRGVSIGYVKHIQLNMNSVTTLIHISSVKFLIPRRCIIEANQTGLFNNTIIDITPIDILSVNYDHQINIFSKGCLKSKFLCHNDYLKGFRGLNYDDLVRAATRISQRFDDPRFFQLFYVCLQNIIDISDELFLVFSYISYSIDMVLDLIDLYLVKYII